MTLVYFRMLNNKFLNKDPVIVPEEDPLIVFDSKYDVCMDNNGKDTEHTRHIARRIHFLRDREKCKMHTIYWSEGDLQLAHTATKNVGEPDLTPNMKYIMVRIDN